MYKRRKQTKEQRQRQVISRLKNENKKLRHENVRVDELEALVEKLRLQIEELQRIIFGGGKKGQKGGNEKDEALFLTKRQNKKRSPESYRRALPQEEEITDTKYYSLDCCPECKSAVTDTKEVKQYQEDILPPGEWYKVLKKVTKEVITTGYCLKCNKRVTAKRITPQKVTLGENVKQFITFSTIISRLSYTQVKDFLEGTTKTEISDGEISNILENQAGQLEPAFLRLKETIRGQPGAHFDETSWKVQAALQGNHAWVMTGTKTTETVFSLGQSRGKGNIGKLQGKDNTNTTTNQVGISDDYGAYKNTFKTHALCWAHPHRKLRDLKNSVGLSMEKQKHCQLVYEEFAKLYGEVQRISTDALKKKERLSAKERLMPKLERVAKPHPLDPLKLKRIKKRLLEQKECYFVCITHKGIPADNNKAERALRHLVLKRKNSYGSKTQKGADTMSILYSVLLSSWWESKETFFQEYSKQFSGS